MAHAGTDRTDRTGTDRTNGTDRTDSDASYPAIGTTTDASAAYTTSGATTFTRADRLETVLVHPTRRWCGLRHSLHSRRRMAWAGLRLDGAI